MSDNVEASDADAKRSADVIVIGGGIQGCSAALHLAESGVDVVVVERAHVGRHASSANAGGVRRIGRHPAELELADASAAMWSDLAGLTGSDGGFKRAGHIFVAENEDELAALRERRDRVQAMGYDFEELVTAGDLRDAVPGISDHVVGGLANWSDGYADPFATVRAFRERAVALGVRIFDGARVEGCRRIGDSWRLDTTLGAFSANHVLNCAGFGGARIAAMFGDDVKISVEAPMMMVTTPIPRYEGPVLGRVRGRLSLKPSSNGSILIGGGHRAVFSEKTQSVSVDLLGLSRSAQTLKALLPDLSLGRLQRAWYGLEAYTADGLPILGPSANSENVTHAFAFSGHGFQLGPVVGRVLSELLVDGQTPFDLSAFDLGRFEDQIQTDNVWCSLGARTFTPDAPGTLPIS